MLLTLTDAPTLTRSLLLKIGLSVLILISAQLILVSPLHDHEDSGRQHLADCNICQLYSNDQVLPADTHALTIPLAHGITQFHPRALLLSHEASPYQGRAPPHISL